MCPIRNAIVHHAYRDSVVLMQISSDLGKRDKIERAAAMMGTPANLMVLRESGLLAIPEEEVALDDIVLGVIAKDDAAADAALDWARENLQTPRNKMGGRSSTLDPDTEYRRAHHKWLAFSPEFSLALISVPGPYAATEARKALRAGRHVFLFSDHVTVEDEVALKQEALEHDLLMMGPECGTSILSGVPLGFANRVHKGSIGVVAASGSGLQEVTCLIDRLGGGITHAIGTGGRDLSPQVGGLTMLEGIDLLLADEATRALIVLSKPPNPEVAKKIVKRVSAVDKPVVVCFLGSKEVYLPKTETCFVQTLEEAALAAVKAIGLKVPTMEMPQIDPEVVSGYPRRLRGLFVGGTLAYEAMVILHELVGPVWSNKPLEKKYELNGSDLPDENLCLDLGSEEYTAGLPHPMISPETRSRILVEQSADPRVGVILLDFILGYGSHPDPVGAMLPAIEEARQTARKDGRNLIFIASVTGTSQDPQPFESQTEKLLAHHVIVAPSNAAAARLAANYLLAGLAHS